MHDADDPRQLPGDPPAFWLEELEESDRELAAGQTEALEPLLTELDRSADEVERSMPELTSAPLGR